MKILKLTLVMLLFSALNLEAQNKLGKNNDVGRIAIYPVIGNIPDMPVSAEKMLVNKMGQIVSKNGMASYGNRFIMYPHVTIMSQNITATAPPMHAYNLDITLYIADNMTQSIFSSTTLSLKGVGKNPTKAYMGALRMLNQNRPEIKNFVEKGKNQIIEYYNSKCEFILKDAESLAARKEFDEAIYTVISIPDICKDCYIRGQDIAIDIFKLKMENECIQNIANARASKAKDNYDLAATYLSVILPDVSCYADAQSLLKQIEDHRCAISLGKAKGAWSSGDFRSAGRWLGEVASDSKCIKEAMALGNEIKAKLKADQDREWDFKVKVQSDIVDMEKQAIKAFSDVGVAFGENQQPTNMKWINMD
tara:strand:- start:1180 stop:2271 length:1092 start_codon:yes stop_codon:yes gene_type:complete